MSPATLVPELYVSDLAASLAFYVDALGFEVEYERPEEQFAALRLGDARLLLEQTSSLARASAAELARGELRTADLERPFGRGINFELRVADVRALGARLAKHGVEPLVDVHGRSYRRGAGEQRVEQLLVADPDGYLLRLSERLESRDEPVPRSRV